MGNTQAPLTAEQTQALESLKQDFMSFRAMLGLSTDFQTYTPQLGQEVIDKIKQEISSLPKVLNEQGMKDALINKMTARMPADVRAEIMKTADSKKDFLETVLAAPMLVANVNQVFAGIQPPANVAPLTLTASATRPSASAPATASYTSAQITAVKGVAQRIGVTPSATFGAADVPRVVKYVDEAARLFGNKLGIPASVGPAQLGQAIELRIGQERQKFNAAHAGATEEQFANHINTTFHVPLANINKTAQAAKDLAAAGVYAVASAPATVTSSDPAALKARTEAVLRIEQKMSALGLNVGAVDGNPDANFHAGITGLRNLLVSFGGGAPSNSQLTLNDISALDSAIKKFVASPDFANLEAIRKGELPLDLQPKAGEGPLEIATREAKAAFFRSTTKGMTPEQRVKWALEYKAGEDPAFKAQLARVPPNILNNMPKVLDVLKGGQSLVADLRTAYTPLPSGTAVAATTPSPATTTAPASTGTPEVVPAAGTTDTSGATPAGPPSQQEIQDASRIVETALMQLGTVVGEFDKMGLSGFVAPTSADGDFDANSQKALHIALMGLKKLNGDPKADGTYNAQVGQSLREAILTKDSFGMLRQQMGITGKYTAEQVRDPKFLDSITDAKEKEKIRQMQMLFESLDTLDRAEKLANDRAKDVTFNGMLMEKIGQFLPDSFKNWIKDFCTNNKFGQMIAGVLTMFGFPIQKLWGGKEEGMEVVKPQVMAAYSQELAAAGYDHAVLKQNIIAKMDDSKAFKAVQALLFRGDNSGLMRRSVESALDAAALQRDPNKAAEVFADTLIKAGEDFQGKRLTAENREQYFQEIKKAYEEEVRRMPGVPAAGPAGASTVTPSSGGPTMTAGAGSSSTVNPATATAGVSGSVRPEIVPAAYTGNSRAPAADAVTVEAGGQKVEFVFSPNTTQFVQGPTRYSYGRVAVLQEVMSQNAKALDLTTRPEMFMNANKPSDMMTRNTNMALEELLVRAQIAKGIVPSAVSHVYDQNTIGIVADYMKAKDISEADIARFTSTVKALDADMKSTSPRNKDAGAVQKASVWDQTYIHNQVIVRAATVAPPTAAPTTASPSADRYPNIKFSDQNDLPPGMSVEQVFDKYKRFNAGRDPNCAPLVFQEGGRAYAGVVIKDTNTFKVVELKGYLDKTGPTYQALSKPNYELLRDNYNWRDGSQTGIINYVNRQLCLEPYTVKADAAPVTTAPVAVAPPLRDNFGTRASETHAVPKNYSELRLLRNEELVGLAGGCLDGRELTRLYDMAVTLGRGSNGIPNGGALLTRLNGEDKARLGGDMIVSVRNLRTQQLEHRIVNFEQDKIKIGSFTERYSPGANIRRLDDFLNTPYDLMSITVPARNVGNLVADSYREKYNFHVTDALRNLYNAEGRNEGDWTKMRLEYGRVGNGDGDGFETRQAYRLRAQVQDREAVRRNGGYAIPEDTTGRCREFNDRVGNADPQWRPMPNHGGVIATPINTLHTFGIVFGQKFGGSSRDTGSDRDAEINQNLRDCGVSSGDGPYTTRSPGYGVRTSNIAPGVVTVTDAP